MTLAFWLLMLFAVETVAQLVHGRDAVDLLRPVFGPLAFWVVFVQLVATVIALWREFDRERETRARVLRCFSTFLLAGGLLCGAAPIGAEVKTSNAIAVTSTAQTVTLTGGPSDVLIVNDSTSANELYFRLFTCGETVAAATTASVRLEKGESRSYRLAGSEGGGGYCAISLVSASAETATARVEWK